MLVTPGEKIKVARKRARPPLSQLELAAMLRKDRADISRIEHNKLHAGSDLISRVAQITGCPEQWFYDESDAPPLEPGNSVVHNLGEVPNVSSVGQVHSTEVLVPIWRGVVAGLADECVFYPSDAELAAVSTAFIQGDPKNYVWLTIVGPSMYPVAPQGSRVLIRFETNPASRDIVAVQRPDGAVFLKGLIQSNSGYLELHSVNPAFPPITNLDGWQYVGVATLIFRPYHGEPNISYDEGRTLKI